jgi:hypothetical protein
MNPANQIRNQMWVLCVLGFGLGPGSLRRSGMGFWVFVEDVFREGGSWSGRGVVVRMRTWG